MSASWWLGNLVAYSVQVALVVAVAALAAALLRLRQPRVMLAYWQALLAACLLLPLLEPWQHIGLGPAHGSATIIGTEAGSVDSLLDLSPLHPWVLPVLVAGVGVGLLRLALGLWRLGYYRRTALRIAPLPGALREAQALVRVAPTFYFSERVESSVTFGWLRHRPGQRLRRRRQAGAARRGGHRRRERAHRGGDHRRRQRGPRPRGRRPDRAGRTRRARGVPAHHPERRSRRARRGRTRPPGSEDQAPRAGGAGAARPVRVRPGR